MRRHRLSDYTRGWFVGDFEPSIIRTKDFECTVRRYQAGDSEARHVHKVADEITVIVSGIFKMNGETLVADDIVHLSPGDAADFECIESGTTMCVKTPSVIGDKYPA